MINRWHDVRVRNSKDATILRNVVAVMKETRQLRRKSEIENSCERKKKGGTGLMETCQLLWKQAAPRDFPPTQTRPAPICSCCQTRMPQLWLLQLCHTHTFIILAALSSNLSPSDPFQL